jgi:type I restriction enzyme M protein
VSEEAQKEHPAAAIIGEVPSEALTEEELSAAETALGEKPKSKKPPLTITDFISGQQVRATPEEVEAVQVFSRRLVEELGYPKTHIRTRPQFSVRSSPSGKGGKANSYPLDIAVFQTDKQLESELSLIVECKRKTRKDGEEQLRIYMGMSPSTQLGVWFNGEDHLYLLREYDQGQVIWSYLPTLPKYGQSIADIGSLRRSDLIKPTNLKAVFRDIRNHLAGNTTGITRDQGLAVEIIAILFCKIYDEINTAPDDLPRFRTAHKETPELMKERLDALFLDVQSEYPDVFRNNELITLDLDSLRYVVGELQNYCVIEASRDAIGDAFEVFIGPAVRGEEGQFFTPRNVVEMIVKIIDPKPGETIIDPACGSGGFLTVALEHVWKALEASAPAMKWSPGILETKKREIASRCFRGFDKDAFLTKVTKAYMAIIGDGRGGVFCQDSLAAPDAWEADARKAVKLGQFDIVITNPPFGSKIKITGEKKLAQFELGKKWKETKKDSGEWIEAGGYKTEQSPQILFIERCIQFLKPDGRLAIVLPESVFGMPVYGYVVQYLFNNFSLRGFVSLPEEVFQPYTHAKTCVLFLKKREPSTISDCDENIEMAIADWCGHDSRGNPTVRMTESGPELLDDLPHIADQMSAKGIWA